jgi:hypothetical protein
MDVDSPSLSIYDSPLRFSFTVYLWLTFEILLHCLFMTHLWDSPSLSIYDPPLRFSFTVYLWHTFEILLHCLFMTHLWDSPSLRECWSQQDFLSNEVDLQVSSSNKTGHHYIANILFKVALNTINLNLNGLMLAYANIKSLSHSSSVMLHHCFLNNGNGFKLFLSFQSLPKKRQWFTNLIIYRQKKWMYLVRRNQK